MYVPPGKVLTEARKARKLTQDELANLVGCVASAISNYERGDREILRDVAIKLGEILKVSPIDLVFGQENEAITKVTVDFNRKSRDYVTVIGASKHMPDLKDGECAIFQVSRNGRNPKVNSGDIILVRNKEKDLELREVVHLVAGKKVVFIALDGSAPAMLEQNDETDIYAVYKSKTKFLNLED